MREEALWGGEVRGRPAAATAARAGGRTFGVCVGGAGSSNQSGLRPQSRRRFDGDLMGECSTL